MNTITTTTNASAATIAQEWPTVPAKTLRAWARRFSLDDWAKVSFDRDFLAALESGENSVAEVVAYRILHS